ncbi:GGDEF domain-containing protein [Cohnella luojiensis]|uniref:EAL domain-containing protein n=1 Tax=Cohnella luojiensis TaxID=652876 RepID=A0A4Y8M1C5_9BACL|nr:GGDEF domain-containing protein [Cohnella luojiensis]TFE27793.1 EAL domain-containing protein [Cohnella luojiensis]
MSLTNGWLDPNLVTQWIGNEGARSSLGMFIVRWDGNQTQAHKETASIPLRIKRSLKAVAMRFAKLSDAVHGWTLSSSSLILMVSVAENEAESNNEDEIAAGRMTFLLRDLSIRAFTDFRGSPSLESGSSIRYGFGWILKSTAMAIQSDSDSRLALENALLSAYETAWHRMFFSGSPIIRFPLPEYPVIPSDFDFKVKYKPIVSLLDGSLYGFEAIPVKAHSGAAINVTDFYRNADQAGQLFEADRRFREAAIRGFPSRNGDVKLFLPVPAKIIYDPRLYPGSTLRRIEAANLRAEHVVLVLIGGEEEQAATIKAALSHYRNQGFRIALSGIIPSFTSLRRMVELHPDYAQMNVDWVSGKGMNPVEESFLQGLTSLTRKEQIVLISNGLDREELLPALVASGMNYAQGEWFEQGLNEAKALAPHISASIRAEINKRYQGATGTLSELVVPVKLFSRETSVSEISRHFELHRESQGIVIADNERPIGLLMKEKLHQMLSGQFGLPLYWNRAVGKIMDTHPMIVDESTSVEQASHMAMAREPDKLYDAVIVTREGLVTGITSIRSILEWVTLTRMNDAQWANPLSGLPGNEPIRRELIRRLAEGRPFAVLYADLDHFKWYNDQYGFHKGDDVIRFTGETLLATMRAQLKCDCFVGHIGGDDFIVLSSGTDPVELARDVIRRFEQGIEAYAGKSAGPVLDRSGHPLEATGLSLSLSLLQCHSTEGWTPEHLSEKAALLKKKAKQVSGNSLVWETISENVELSPEAADLTAH